MYTIYVVYEGTNYQDFPNGRYDIGPFHTKTYTFESLKEVMKFGSEFAEKVIDEIVFFDKQEAIEYEIKCTIDKLQKVVYKINGKGE